MKTLFNLYLSLNESKKLFTEPYQRKKRKLQISSYWSSFLLYYPRDCHQYLKSMISAKLSWISSSLSHYHWFSVSSCGKAENNKTALRILHYFSTLLYFLVFNNFNNFSLQSQNICLLFEINGWILQHTP